MRLLLALAVMVVALVAWLAFGSRRETGHDASVPMTPNTSAESASPSSAELEPLPGPDDSLRTRESVSPVSIAPANAPVCRVLGRVVDPRGTVVTGARVMLFHVGDKSNKEGARFDSVTGSDGRFLFETLPPANIARLRVTASEFLSIGERAFGTAQGQDSPKLAAGDNDVGDIGLLACGVIAGRALTEDGLPAAGVTIAIRGDAVMDTARTGEDGRYCIGQFDAGRYTIAVEAGAWLSSEKIVVDVVAAHVTDVRDIVVRRAAAIAGVVVDDAGAPAAKVMIKARTHDMSGRTTARSAADGSFTLYLPKADPFTLEVAAFGEFGTWGGVVGDPRFTFEPGTSGVRIVLARLPGMTFRVIDAVTRAPIERFGLRVLPRDPPGSMNSKHMQEIKLEDHPNGEARLPAPGDSVVAVTAPDHADVEIPVALDAGSSVVQTIALPRPSGITGRVRIGETLVKGAAVHLSRDTFTPARKPSERLGTVGQNMRSDVGGFPGRPRSTETNDAGLFDFTSLAPGTYALSIEFEGTGKKWLRMLSVPHEDTLRLGDIELEPEAIVRGVVITGFGESPIGFEITAWDHPEKTIQNADGKFEFRGLPPGPFSFYWHRPNDNRGTWDGDPKRLQFDLRAGETREVVIDASPTTPCVLRVQVQEHGQPVAGVAISARMERSNGGWVSSIVGTTDANGLAVCRVEGGARVRLAALSAAKTIIGRVPLPIDTVPGGELACAIDLGLGKLQVELPATITKPEHGRVTVRLDDDVLTRTALTGTERVGQSVWSTSLIEFGEFPSGSWDVELRIERFERDTASDNPKAGKWVPLRASFKTRIEIKEGEATLVVVPGGA